MRRPKKSALLVLDEPTASLDENTKKEVVNQIEELSKSLCVIVASHDEELCRRMDACYILEDGTLKTGDIMSKKKYFLYLWGV